MEQKLYILCQGLLIISTLAVSLVPEAFFSTPLEV